MTVSDANIQTLIILEVGDTDSGVLAANMSLIWSSYADKAQTGPRLQELYSKRRAIDIVVGATRKQVDFMTPTLEVKQSQELDRLADLREETETEIERIEKKLRGNRGISLAQLTTTAPESVPTSWPLLTGVPDANSEALRGDPYFPLRGPER